MAAQTGCYLPGFMTLVMERQDTNASSSDSEAHALGHSCIISNF